MKKWYKIFFIIIGIILLITFGIFGGLIGSGNYGYAQQYQFDTTESALTNIVEHFKDENPDYRVPKNVSLPDCSDSSGRYHFYIYYSRENELVHCFIWNDINNANRSSIYLDALNEGSVLGNWKVVNSTYGRRENLNVKMKFKERVLNKLKLPYVDKGNGMLIFWK